MTARLGILAEIERLTSEPEIGTTAKAIERFLALNAAGALSESITQMIGDANQRKGANRTLTRETIYVWGRAKRRHGNIGLAPADKENIIIPPWSREFLATFRLPSKPTVPQVLESMADRAPSYGQALRFLKKFSRVDVQRGRMSGSELRSIRGYTQRDKSNLMPMDVVVADGHSFKAKVSHPIHGKPFHPEMEGIIDTATRACIGWSVGLAESSHVVADALRHSVTVNEKKPFGGVPAIFYADQGAGNTAKAISHIEMGVLARIGSQFKTGIPGNPQGRGVIERLQASLWIRAAKQLPTYTGKDMDTLSQRRIMKIVNKDIKLKGTSDQLITWSRFLGFCGEQVAAYNNRPHSALLKIRDKITGLRRHMTPAEMWQAFAADGWQPTLLSDDEIKDLFKPMIRVKIRRAQVTVFGNIYYHKTLEHYHGEDALVNYDIHDAKIVWVRDTSQRLICEAVWDANKREYFPVPVIEQARQKRMEGRLKRLDDQAYEVRQERKGVINAASLQEDPIIAAMRPMEPEPERELIMTLYEDNFDDDTSKNDDVDDESASKQLIMSEYDIDNLIDKDVAAESTSEREEFETISLKSDSEYGTALRAGTDAPSKPLQVIRVGQKKKLLRGGVLEFDLDCQTVKAAGVFLNLRPTERKILRILMESPGRVFSRQELLKATWRGGMDAMPAAITTHISRLNTALKKVNACYVRNRKGSEDGGYFFEAPDAESCHAVAESA